MTGLFGALNPRSDEPIEKRSVRSGITLAKITNIKDPKNLGRVKCAYITSDQDAGETGWIHCLTPLGGDQYGAFFIRTRAMSWRSPARTGIFIVRS